jgi:hypothetical protein
MEHFIEKNHYLCGVLNHLTRNPIAKYELGSVEEVIFGFVLQDVMVLIFSLQNIFEDGDTDSCARTNVAPHH